MSVSFEGIFPGDRVHIKLAEPLAGWIEGNVHSSRHNDVKLACGPGEMDYLHLVREEVESVAVIQPPIKPVDLVWFDGYWWAVRSTRMPDGPLVVIRSDGLPDARISADDIPADAVWLVRGGKLNPLLAGEA